MSSRYFDEENPYGYYLIYRDGKYSFYSHLIDFEMFVFYNFNEHDYMVDYFYEDKLLIVKKDSKFLESFLKLSTHYDLQKNFIYFNEFDNTIQETLWLKYLNKNYSKQEELINKFMNYINEKRKLSNPI